MLFLLILMVKMSFAQQTVITRTVADVSGELLPGVIVTVNKSSTATDAEGKFRISLNSITDGDIIEFKFLGFVTQKVNIKDNQNLKIILVEDFNKLNEVVVTALNIKRDQKSLGYATQTISSEQLNDSRSNNWESALSGKVAGLSLLSSGSGPLNSTRIVLKDSSKSCQLILPTRILRGCLTDSCSLKPG